MPNPSAVFSGRPDDMVEGGGGAGYQGGPCQVRKPRFVLRTKSDYRVPGEPGDPETAVLFAFTPEHQGDEGGLAGEDELQSVGNGYTIAASMDNLIPVSEGPILVGGPVKKSSNYGIFMLELQKCGFANWGPNVDDSYDGLCLNTARIPQPDRGGSIPGTNAKGFKRTILVPTEILEEKDLPWKAKGAVKAATPKTGNGTKAAASKASAPAAEEDDYTDLRLAIVSNIMEANKKGITKSKMFSAITKEIDANFKDETKRKSDHIKAILAPDFLGGHGDIFEFDGSTGMLTPA